jgi:hypothetical protein
MRKLFIIIILIPFFYSCEEKADITKLNITVRDATTWTLENNMGTLVPGATVMLFQPNITDFGISDFTKNQPDFKGVTDENGQITFNIILLKYLFIIVEKDNLSNLIDPEIENNRTKGYIVISLFQDQADIDGSASQSNATVGGIKIWDVNADGVINSNDKIVGFLMNLSSDVDYSIYITDKNVNPL